MSGTCVKDTRTKPKEGTIKGEKLGWLGWGEMVGREWRQLYLNNNKKKEREKKSLKKVTNHIIKREKRKWLPTQRT